MGIKELLNVVAEPRNRFGGQVWANNWKRWSLTVTNVLSIENPTGNQWYPLQFQKDLGKFSKPTCSVLTGGHISWCWITSRASSKYHYCWRPRKWNDTRIKVDIRQTRNTRYLQVWKWATIGLNGIRRALKGLLAHTCDVKPKAAAYQWRGGANGTLIKNALKKEKDPAKAHVSYKATPLENGYSPTQMLFGTKIRTTVPVFPDQLKPTWPGLQELCEHEQESKIVQTNVTM